MRVLGLIFGGLAAMALAGCTAYAPDSKMQEVAPMAPGSWAATKQGKAGFWRQPVEFDGERGVAEQL